MDNTTLVPSAAPIDRIRIISIDEIPCAPEELLDMCEAGAIPVGSIDGENVEVLAIIGARTGDLAPRLVAAWNAFEGMPTKDIEELAATNQAVTRLVVYADDMRKAVHDALAPPPGWVIVHADRTRWRTLDSLGMPDWTEDPTKALNVTLREHAERYSEDDPEDVRIVPALRAGDSAELLALQAELAADEALTVITSYCSRVQGKLPGSRGIWDTAAVGPNDPGVIEIVKKSVRYAELSGLGRRELSITHPTWLTIKEDPNDDDR